jgi:hypothetical protein
MTTTTTDDLVEFVTGRRAGALAAQVLNPTRR